MAVLTLNAGSSSLKFAVFDDDGRTRRRSGEIDGVGRGDARLTLDAAEPRPVKAGDHAAALEAALTCVRAEAIAGVGHRIVHGGAEFDRPVAIDPGVEAHIEALTPLAPLHQKHNLAALRAAREAWPDAVQVACFDTAFHRTRPFIAEAFALPRRYYDQGVRRYGFHGLSYQYLSARLSELEGRAASRAVLAHLGSGASMCAISDGVSRDTSMGFSALDGLPMATRCGQIDPGVLLYLMSEEGLGADALTDLLYKESGLKGLSGTSGDMRELERGETGAARDAFDYFIHRCRREIAALCASLEGLDALVFSAGIGEHSAGVRAAVCAGLGWLGVRLDEDANAAARGEATRISAPESAVRVWMIPTDEERVIAEAAARFL
ncbi:MAG: acetate/propionate family kinase [Oceanicaulis sp.]